MEILLLNGSAVQVWIDNRPSNLSGAQLEALLSGTDGSTIDKIEIMAHPSSKYDASGSGGIINIKTKKNFAKGINGSVRAAYTGAPYDKYYQGADGTLNLNYRSEKTNTSVTYSPRLQERFNDFYSTTNMGNGVILEGGNYVNCRYQKPLIQSNKRLVYKQKEYFGVIVNGFFRDGNDKTDDDITGSTLFNNGAVVGKTATSIVNSDYFKTISGNLNYTYIFKEGQEITLNADYGRYNTNQKSHQENIFTDNDGDPTRLPSIFRSNSDQFINIISAKADYEQIIFKKLTNSKQVPNGPEVLQTTTF